MGLTKQQSTAAELLRMLTVLTTHHACEEDISLGAFDARTFFWMLKRLEDSFFPYLVFCPLGEESFVEDLAETVSFAWIMCQVIWNVLKTADVPIFPWMLKNICQPFVHFGHQLDLNTFCRHPQMNPSIP
jgi:hypothetical protein